MFEGFKLTTVATGEVDLRVKGDEAPEGRYRRGRRLRSRLGSGAARRKPLSRACAGTGSPRPSLWTLG